jgi:hypothetical protein
LWEHVLHQQHTQQQSFQPFLASTLAYASLLLAMEDMQLPLVDKQACCLALLQLAGLSTHTPYLSKAYNWLVYAKNLQAQLVAVNQRQQTTNTPVTPAPSMVAPTRVVSPTTTATVTTGHEVPPATKEDFQPPQPPPHQPSMLEKAAVSQSLPSSTAIPVVSPVGSTATTATCTTMEDVTTTFTTHTHGSMVVEESMLSINASSCQKKQHFLHPSTEVEDNDSFFPRESSDHLLCEQEDETEDGNDLSEVIFYSHTYTGDGFEVMAVDKERGEMSDYDDADSMDHHPSYTQAKRRSDATLFKSSASTEVSIAHLPVIMAESSDEDGFEVSYADDDEEISNDMQSYSALGKFLVSPTDVIV